MTCLRHSARVIDAPIDSSPPLRAPSPKSFDAPGARRACAELIETCQTLADAPAAASLAEARPQLIAFGRRAFALLRALLPGASDSALAETAEALTMIAGASRVAFEPARVLEVSDEHGETP